MESLNQKFSKHNYTVEPIQIKAARSIVIEKHYLHRAAPCTKAYGLFEIGGYFGGILKGVICYGVSVNPIFKSICGKEEARNVYELTRLWIEDEVPKNGESFLIGNSLKKLDREIIISYADPTMNHRGVVYQSTNWYYLGKTKAIRDAKIKGLDLHGASVQDKYRGEKNRIDKLKQEFGEENIYYESRTEKHRYVIFNANKKRKRELLNKLTFKIEEYPK